MTSSEEHIEPAPPAANACSSREIEDILERGEVQTFYQPLVSVDERTVIGFEAYARGVITERDVVIKPRVLFDSCHDTDTQLRIDRLCRQSALERFRNIYDRNRGILLFVNVNAEGLRSSMVEEGTLDASVQAMEYDPRHIVIELRTDRLDMEVHGPFIDFYRQLGFLFSLDDFQSTDLDKLHLVRPDFVKIGRESFEGLSERSYQRELLGSLKRFASDVGCRVAAKGVETEEEAFMLLDNDVHLQQGFYFTKKKSDTGQNASQIFQEKIQELYARYKKRISDGIRSKKQLFEGYNQSMPKIVGKFEKSPVRDYSEVAKLVFTAVPDARTLFLLDERGQEVGNRYVHLTTPGGGRVLRELRSNKDHSIQDYFLHLQMGFERFVTRPFISPQHKTRHCLISRRFFNVEGRSLVLCAEFPYPDDLD